MYPISSGRLRTTTTKATLISKLQTLQNSALRIATGCMKMTNVGHLHAEASVLPVSDHLSLLSSQFLARCLVPSHPSHQTVTAPSGPRQMKHTLQSRFFPTFHPILQMGCSPQNPIEPPSSPFIPQPCLRQFHPAPETASSESRALRWRMKRLIFRGHIVPPSPSYALGSPRS